MTNQQTKHGKLCIVATPIGNMEDITLRAIRTLKESDLIAAEDTRISRKLLSKYDIHVPITAYHKFSNDGKTYYILQELLSGKNISLISDAGTPGISDPGYELIEACIKSGIEITIIPGASAVIAGIVLSGLPTSNFIFDGFPPRKPTELTAYFKTIKNEKRTICLYEAPLRLVKTLSKMQMILADRQIAIIREATKCFEEVFRGKVSEAITHFSSTKVRGEIVIVIKGSEEIEKDLESNLKPLNQRLLELMEEGVSDKEAIKQCVAEYNLSKKLVYAEHLRIKKQHQV